MNDIYYTHENSIHEVVIKGSAFCRIRKSEGKKVLLFDFHKPDFLFCK